MHNCPTKYSTELVGVSMNITTNVLGQSEHTAICQYVCGICTCKSSFEPRQAKKWLRVLPTNRENHQNVTVGKILLERDRENIHFSPVCKRMKREAFSV